jgi:hypothetical protein
MIKIIIKQYNGDDKYSWAIFRSDKKEPCFTGLLKNEVPYYRKLTQEQINKEKVNGIF